MTKVASRLLRVGLAVLLFWSVLAQILVPVRASEVGARFAEVASLVVPYSVAAILAIGCGQVALLATWRLLSLVDGGVIVTPRGVRWMDVIVIGAAVATALAAGVLIHMLRFVPGGGGPMIHALAACIIAGLAFTSLAVVVRGRLASAVAHRAALHEGI